MQTEITAEQFAEQRHEFPDGGRWTELVGGQLRTLEPPDVVHGNVVLHLSKALAEHMQARDDSHVGSVYFELGMLVARSPDSLHFPAISYVSGQRPFEQADRVYTETPPSLIVEIASTAARRATLVERISSYHEWGVDTTWVIDPVNQEVGIARRGQRTRILKPHDALTGVPVLAAFSIKVSTLFDDPTWWKS